MRITNSDLEYLAKRINEVTGNNIEPWTRENGRSRANIGTYYISGAYGGVELVQMVSVGGGVDAISKDGHDTKRKLHSFMTAYLAGFNAGNGRKLE